jgi:hypothetical protein
MPLSWSLSCNLGFWQSGVLSSRSVMLTKLMGLIVIALVDAGTGKFPRFMNDEDALHKPAVDNTTKTTSFLGSLYGLNPQLPICREFTRLRRWSLVVVTVFGGSHAFAPVLLNTAIGI